MPRGPKPTPTVVLAARGSWRAKINPQEPTAQIEPPDCPGWLVDEAKQVWYAMVPLLLSLRVITRIDGAALAVYCDAFVKWKKVATLLNGMDLVYPVRDGSGNVVGVAPYPHHRLYDQYAKIVERGEAKFGLSPAARSRIIAAIEGASTPSQGESDERLQKLIPSIAI